MTTVTPEVLWAQRSSGDQEEKNFIYLTISVPDVTPANLKLDLKPTGLTFTGASDTLKKTYHLELEFYGEIDPTKSNTHHTPKNIEIKLQKKELSAEYWPRLLKDSKKVHFLKTDFDKWVDEDEQNEAAEEDFSQFGGGMGGMPGLGGGNDFSGGDFGGIDFSKLGGAGAPEEEQEGDDEDDDEMPPLEGEGEDDDGEADKEGEAAGKGADVKDSKS
jgi:hypothetical protein